MWALKSCMIKVFSSCYSHCFTVGTPFTDSFVVGQAVVKLGLAMNGPCLIVKVVIANEFALEQFKAIPDLIYTELCLMDFRFKLVHVISDWFILANQECLPNIRGTFLEAFQVVLDIVYQVTWNGVVRVTLDYYLLGSCVECFLLASESL